MTISKTKERILELDTRGFFDRLLNAATHNTLAQLRERLRHEGEDFSKEEFLYKANGTFPNLVCYSSYGNLRPINYIDYIQQVLNEVGDRLTIRDWQTEFVVDGTTFNFISYAASQNLLSKVFKPEVWVGHVDEMKQLWQLVPEYDRQQIDFGALRTEALKFKRSIRTKPIVLTTAHTGARYSPWQKSADGKDIEIGENFYAQHMPITVEQAINDACEAYEAGSRFIHLHARNPRTGVQYADPNWYRQVAEGIRKHCKGAIISFPTSRKGEVGPEIDLHLRHFPKARSRKSDIERRAQAEFEVRASGIEAQPDTLTTFTVPEMKIFGEPKDSRGVETVPGWTDTEVMQAYFKIVNQRAKELGVRQEIEITTMGEFDVLDQLAKRKKEFNFNGPLHVVLILGFSDGLPINRNTYEEALNRVEQLRKKTGFDITVSCGAVIRPSEAAPYPGSPVGHDYNKIMRWVSEDNRVDAFRVGLEDTPTLYNNQQTNRELVEDARDFFESNGIKVETQPTKVRKIFYLPKVHPFKGAVKKDDQPNLVATLFAQMAPCFVSLSHRIVKMHYDTRTNVGIVAYESGGAEERLPKHAVKIYPKDKSNGVAILELGKEKKELTDPSQLKEALSDLITPTMSLADRYRYRDARSHSSTLRD